MSVLNKAMGLAYHELMGNADNINTEVDKYVSVTAEEIMKVATENIHPNNCSTLIYHRKKPIDMLDRTLTTQNSVR